jgi:RNase P subunit RPR2
MTDERREALRVAENERRELDDVLKDHVCAECGSPLAMGSNLDREQIRHWFVMCSQHWPHQGYRRLKSTYEKWVAAGRPREGTAGHVMTVCEENMKARQEVRRRIRKVGY